MLNGARVVVTGLGLVTPLGHSIEQTAAALTGPAASFAPPAHFDPVALGVPRVAEISGFDATPYFRVRKAIKLAHRTTRFAVAAASMALTDAGWATADTHDQLGVVIGTSGSDPQVVELQRALRDDADREAVRDISVFGRRVLEGLNPLWLLVGLPNMPSSHVAIQLQARGPNSTIMTDWIAGAQAIGEAAQWIARGEATAVLAGGADSALYPHACANYHQLLADAPGPVEFVPGEGAGVLLLEDRGHALARGASIKAEVLGFAAGTSLRHTECTVRAAIRDQPVPVTAVTGPAEYADRLGHALAAAGPIDAALAIHAFASGLQSVFLCNAAGYGTQAATLAFANAAAARHQQGTH